MKKFIFFCLAIVFLTACKKDNSVYKVTYLVTGNNVEQFKISYNASDNFMRVPFFGSRDTTVYKPAGTLVKLDIKAHSEYTHPLYGAIYVNDSLAVTLTDWDVDGDGKTQVKIEYALPKN
jgi:hypothetical protein